MPNRDRVEFERTVTLEWHSCSLVHYAMIQRLKEVESNLRILQEARELLMERDVRPEVDLPQVLRYQLPGHMQGLTLEELAENVDPWITLQDYCKDLIKQFDPERDADGS